MLEYGPIVRVDCDHGHLYRTEINGWNFWQSRGLVKFSDLTRHLDITAPTGDFNPDRYIKFLANMKRDISRLMTQGGVISADGSTVEFSLDSINDLPELMARTEYSLAARFEEGALKDRYGITFDGKVNRRRAVYYLAPGIKDRLSHRTSRHGLMYMGVISQERDGHRQVDDFSLENVLVRAVPNYVALQESKYGVVPVYTRRAITKAALVDLTQADLSYQFRA